MTVTAVPMVQLSRPAIPLLFTLTAQRGDVYVAFGRRSELAVGSMVDTALSQALD